MATVSTILTDRIEDAECGVPPWDEEFEPCDDGGRSQACPVVDESLVLELIHDIRNTLGAVAVLSELTLVELAEDSSMRAMAREVHQASREASAQCQRVLTAFRGIPARTESTDLSALVREATPLLATCVPGESVLRFNLANDLPPLELAPGEIRQLVMNLVKNAGAAVRDRPGVVTVSTGWIESVAAGLGDGDGRRVMRSSGQAYLAVSDTGCGMEETTRSDLRAGRSISNADGHGLGLASVRRVVAFHGAQLQSHSRLGTGTRVSVVFGEKLPVNVPISAGNTTDRSANGDAEIRVVPLRRSQEARCANSVPDERNSMTILSLRSAESAAGDTFL